MKHVESTVDIFFFFFFFFFFVPRLFEEKWRDTVFGFPWGVVRGSEFLVGTLSPFPQFLSDPFETLQVFKGWSEDVHVVFFGILK